MLVTLLASIALASPNEQGGAVSTIQIPGLEVVGGPPGASVERPKSILDEEISPVAWRDAPLSTAITDIVMDKAPYRLAEGVDASISAALGNVTLADALDLVVSKAGATYDFTDGIIRIFRPSKDKPLKFERTDFRAALRKFMKSYKVSYSIAPEVQGVVTADLTGLGFEHALRRIVKAVKAEHWVESGVVCIAMPERKTTQQIPG